MYKIQKINELNEFIKKVMQKVSLRCLAKTILTLEGYARGNIKTNHSCTVLVSDKILSVVTLPKFNSRECIPDMGPAEWTRQKLRRHLFASSLIKCRRRFVDADARRPSPGVARQ